MNLELIILCVNAVIILTMKVLRENRKQKLYKQQLHFWIRKLLIKCRRITMRNKKCQFNVKIMNEDR